MATNFLPKDNNSKPEYFIKTEDLDYDYTLSILIIGASGKGKSTFCNFLVNKRDVFQESCGFESVTDKVESCVREISNENLLIIDCPGLGDPIKSDTEIFGNISEAAILTCDGVDVVGLLLNPCDRFSDTDKQALVSINSLGGDMWKHTFIIFNNASKIEKRHEKKAENYIDYIRTSPKASKALKELLDYVDGRYVCVESAEFWDKEEYWESKSKEIVEMIREIKNKNNGVRYRNDIMDKGRVQKMKLKHDKHLEILNRELKLQKQQMGIFIQNQQNQNVELQDRITYMEEEQMRKKQGQIIHGLRDYTLSVLVIGTSDCGKSAFCNFLAKEQYYLQKNNGLHLGTKKVEHCVRQILTEKLLIIDTRGYGDVIVIPDEELVKEISETDILTSDGVDVVILIVNIFDKFSYSYKAGLKNFEKLGGNMWNHTFIIFNHADKIEKDHKQKAEDYIKKFKNKGKSTKDIKDMLELVGGRFVCIESVETFGDYHYWECKSQEIIDMIRNIKDHNGERYKNVIMKRREKKHSSMKGKKS